MVRFDKSANFCNIDTSNMIKKALVHRRQRSKSDSTLAAVSACAAARRVATLLNAAFLTVQALKFTENTAVLQLSLIHSHSLRLQARQAQQAKLGMC